MPLSLSQLGQWHCQQLVTRLITNEWQAYCRPTYSWYYTNSISHWNTAILGLDYAHPLTLSCLLAIEQSQSFADGQRKETCRVFLPVPFQKRGRALLLLLLSILLGTKMWDVGVGETLPSHEFEAVCDIKVLYGTHYIRAGVLMDDLVFIDEV